MANTTGSVGDSVFVGFTAGAAITEGQILVLDSNGHVVPSSTDQDKKFIGVANGDAASGEVVSVQVGGIVRLYGWKDGTSGHTTAIAPGELVCIGTDAGNSYTGQVVVHAPDDTSTDPNATMAGVIGRALEAVSTDDTRTLIKVLLK